jgi:quinolinate synthase
MYNINDLVNYGYLKLDLDKSFDFISEINKLRKEKNAVILAHYYQVKEIQDIADFVGDSLALAQQASKTEADILLVCGVHFMAETAKIICPDRKVLLPDLKAGCSLAESCNADDFKKFKENHSDRIVISYVNTSAEIKALTDIVCTSSNALQVVESVPRDKKILFAPDRNLGNYIKSKTDRDILVWDGACHVHEEFSLEKILELKKENPKAKIISHPECKKQILIISDFIGSTAALLKFVKEDSGDSYIVVTESGILHQMKKNCPDKNFIPAPPIDSTCGCNDCNFMKLNTLQKIYIALKYEKPEIIIEEEIRRKAEIPIIRMMELSKNLKN